MQFGMVPYYTAVNSKVPIVCSSIANSDKHYPVPPVTIIFSVSF